MNLHEGMPILRYFLFRFRLFGHGTKIKKLHLKIQNPS